jgi:hypothetical protein
LNGEPVSEISYIEFDVSIVVAESSETNSSNEKGAGAEIRVLSLGGINGKAGNKKDENFSSSSQLNHRVSFKVPVCMTSGFNVE